MTSSENLWAKRRCSLLRRLLVSILGCCSFAIAGPFRASVVKIDITPDRPQWLMGYGPRQSTGVHDRLFHRIVAMDDGTTQFYVISTDICLYSPALYDDVTKEIEKQTDIKPLQIWWTVTHTHAAPELGPMGIYSVFMGERTGHDHNTEYSAWVENRLIEGIKEARAKLQPARLGVGWGMAMANINRRARDEEGPAFLGLNPDGPADRRIGLLRLEKADSSLMALIANYAMHGTVLGDENKTISGDGPGIVADYVEEKLGAPMLYINGAAGNMAPIYTVYPDFESGHLSQFRVLLGDKIISAYHLMGPATPEVRLALREATVETPRRPGLGWTEELSKYTRTTSTGATMVRLPIRYLRINDDIAVWSAPVELFCEIAMHIRSLSPFPYTFYFGYSNGWLGYLPSKAEFAYGGYEPKTSPFTDQAEGDLTRTVVSLLQGETR
jgi:neutral ceramidase